MKIKLKSNEVNLLPLASASCLISLSRCSESWDIVSSISCWLFVRSDSTAVADEDDFGFEVEALAIATSRSVNHIVNILLIILRVVCQFDVN